MNSRIHSRYHLKSTFTLPSMNAIITSRHNTLCQLARSLHHTKYRRKHGLFFIEGENAVYSAIHAKWELTAVFCAPADVGIMQALLAKNGYPISMLHQMETSVLQSISETQTSPRFAAIGKLKSTFDPAIWQQAKVLLVLDGVSDPGNVGTLLRAADAAGTGGVILTGNSADPYSPKVIRSSAGSIFHCPMALIDHDALLAHSADEEFAIVAADAHGGVNFRTFAWPQKYFLVLGNEKHGISPQLLAAAHHRVTIPIQGRAESLNVAMAGTVLLFV